MTSDALEKLLTKHIAPMFPGSRVALYQRNGGTSKLATLDHDDPSRIQICWGSQGVSSYLLNRFQEFSQGDASFITSILRNIKKAEPIEASYLFEEIISPAIRRAVAQQVAPSCVDVATGLMRRLESWAEQTYEGRPITAAIGLDPSKTQLNTVSSNEVFAEGFGVVMANGLESFLTVGSDGSVCDYRPFPDDAISTKILSPLRFARLAEWAAEDRAGIALTRNGEILVFSSRGLSFAKRRGLWLHFPHSAIIDRMRLGHTIERKLSRAVYETSLDVSFARTGGGIGILRPQMVDRFLAGTTISEKDRVNAKSVKGRFLNAVIQGKRFQDLDRRLRQDLVAIDGSTVIQPNGVIVAVGAIIEITAGSEGGGRLAAAQKLGEFGLGLKISSDGAIKGFRMTSVQRAKKTEQKPGLSFEFG